VQLVDIALTGTLNGKNVDSGMRISRFAMDIPQTFKQADAQMYADKMMRKAGAQTGQHEAVDEKYP